jgi:hypothetical protein
MNPALVSILDDLRRRGFADLAGSRAAIDLAIPQALINQAVAGALAGSQGRLRGVTVTIHPGYRFHLDLQLSLGFIRSIPVEAVIDRQPELPGSPVIVFRFRLLLRGLAALAGSVASFFKVLPAGVRLEGDHLFLDLRPLLDRAGASDLLPLLSELSLSTREDLLDVHLVARVSEQP